MVLLKMPSTLYSSAPNLQKAGSTFSLLPSQDQLSRLAPNFQQDRSQRTSQK